MRNSAATGEGAADRTARLAAVFVSEAAFRAFYERALPRVYGYLYHRCGGDESVAEELTQQTFATAVRARRTFDGRADPLTWLTGIARHKLADHFRRLDRDEHRRVRLVVRELAVESEARAWRGTDEREAIARTLTRLPALQRAVLVLHYADGLSVRETASEIGRTEGATESLLSRARESFRRTYGEPIDE